MQDNFEDIWDAMIKTAVIKNSYDEIKDYPPIKVINQMEIPRQYKVKMEKVVRQYQKQVKIRKIAKHVWRVASLLLVVMGIAFIFALQFDVVRASCKNVVKQIYEKFVQYDFKSLDNSENPFEVGFVPEEYSLEVKESNNDGMNITYKDNSGNMIKIFYFNNNRTIYLDNEHYRISDIQINNVAGEVYEADTPDFDNYIIWRTDKGCFYITSRMDISTMRKIAESIK